MPVDIGHGAPGQQSGAVRWLWTSDSVKGGLWYFEPAYSSFAETDSGEANGGRMEASGTEEGSSKRAG